MKKVKIQGHDIDPEDIVNSEGSIGVKAGACNPQEACLMVGLTCEHGTPCVKGTDDQPRCDCSGSGYQGVTCHFGKISAFHYLFYKKWVRHILGHFLN